MNFQHLAVMIAQSAQKYADQPAMNAYYANGEGAHPGPISYAEMYRRIRTIGRALLSLGVQPGDRIGIFAPNCSEWTLVDFGILSVRAVPVPIYATNTRQQAAYIIDETEMTLLFVGDQEAYAKIAIDPDRSPALRTLIVFDEGDAEEETPLHAPDLHFGQFLQLGADTHLDGSLDGRLAEAGPDELATIIYTSGTTGEPKGVMLTHANLLHQFKALDGQFHVGPGDRSLCFLPLSHVYERSWSYYIFHTGAENYYLTDSKAVIAGMQAVKPTVMVSVPRLYEKIFAAAHHGLEEGSGLKKKLFHWALGVGFDYQLRRKEDRPIGVGLTLQQGLADRLVLSKIRTIVGGDKKFFSAGGAPLAPSIEEFFFAAGLLICEGYGLTETSPMVTCNTPNAFKFGTVGRPIVDCQVKIAANGEILVKSPSVTQGYYRKPEATAAAFVDGWFHTGDVGEFDDEGFLRITDRIKDLIITSGGKNVAPQHIETVLAQDYFIEQSIAIGDRRKYISVLIVPNFVALEEYAAGQGITWQTRQELVDHPTIVAFYQSHIDHYSQELAPFEQVKAFTLLPAPLTQEGGEITPSQKTRRRAVMAKYAHLIEAMY
ncbi:MAG: long-chain fatty acid--CoA ligase [Caldilineaceae bacterium]|nr:long-chain fatty acid--CoA ligase [Caldilineaceae bacterium]HRJ40676.1 long-chain fatty acid--CoA ligase [Caldilineaceae bacterium]